MSYGSKGDITKWKILEGAAGLFAEKGYTETSIRELAKAADLKNPASLYHHFPTKNAILEFMLEDYTESTIDVFEHRNISGILRENPTAKGVLACYQTVFPADRTMYYLNVLCVLLQEQLRNPLVRDYVSEQIILRAEVNTGKIIAALKELGIIRQDTDPDYWMKAVSSLFYSFAVRMMLGVGDNAPGFKGMGMMGMLEQTFANLLEKHAV